MQVRRFRPGEERTLHAVFRSAVHGLASKDYTPEQILAWAPNDMDEALWARRIQHIQPFVVEVAGVIAAYADLQPSGYIDHFFVSAEHARRGVGRVLMAHLHELALEARLRALTSDVSLTALPFFATSGFVVVAPQSPLVRGITIPNVFMRKQLRLRAADHVPH